VTTVFNPMDAFVSASHRPLGAGGNPGNEIRRGHGVANGLDGTATGLHTFFQMTAMAAAGER
jgi:hypothetical protein